MDARSPISVPLDVMRGPNLNESARNEKALQELEGVFLNLLMKEMRKSVPQAGLFGESHAQKMFTEMLDEVYAQKMAESGQLGLAKMMAEQIELQSRQREIREALHAAEPGRFFRNSVRSGAPQYFELPQLPSRQEFMTVKSPPDTADMFPVDGPW